MSEWLEGILLFLAVLFLFSIGVVVGYDCGTKDMDKLRAEKAVMQYVKLEADLKAAETQRDECRRFVNEWVNQVKNARR